ncbi:MAG: hypothetical protein IKM83_01045 [Paludibacteraceae bacterium]|nr:hypothetical protein [Paludibacteraceae bacterium]
MKRFWFICILYSVLCLPMLAVDYCAPSSWGYAGNVTGGSAAPTLVTNESQLASALNTKNSVIIITQDIIVTNHISTDKDNLTILALPGKKLISNKQNATESGILYLKGNNLLLRNLTLVGPGAYDCDGWDLLCLDKATNVWVDHCDFQDGCDGNFDIKGKSDNITVTWCRFRYLKEPKAGGSGGAADHRFSNLVGSGSSDKPADQTYNITYGFCWWDEGCKQRMARCRNALIHYLNCYWNSSAADYYVGPENASCYFEGCTFAGKANSPSKIWSPFNSSTNYCTFVNCSGNLPANSSTPVDAPDYTYDQLTPATAKSYVTNSSCGAGATLTVTNTAEVSSACNGGDDPGPEPVVSGWWNISDDDFKDLGTITAETVVRDLHIVATSDKTVIIDEAAASVDGQTFTHRLKLGGTGDANYRHLQFGVTGACSITVYLTSSANSGDARTLNIASGSFGNIISTMSAPAGSVNKQTYAYSGDATQLYLYSANSGINIYGIQVVSSASQIPSCKADPVACKILRDGQVLIRRENQLFNLLGHHVE